MLPFLIIFSNLGLGGVQRKIVDIANFLAEKNPDLPIFILLRRKENFDLSREIKNPRVKIIYYLDWLPFRIPFFFPIFILYQVWRLKPKAALSFLDFYSLSAIWAKLLLFPLSLRVVVSEDHYASRVVRTYRFGKLRLILMKFFYPFSDRIFTCTEANKKDLIESYCLPQEKISVIHNWTNFGNGGAPHRIRKPKYDLIFTGRLFWTKNLKFLLRGVKNLKNYKKDIKLCIVGSGEEEKTLKSFARRIGIESNVEFVGEKYEIEEFLQKSKIFVLSSQLQVEGFPLAILEAMAVGLPILVRNFAGVKEVIKDGQNGFIFSSMEEFVKKTRWLLSNSRERKKVGQRAHEYIKKHHSSKNIREYLEALGI